MCTGRAKGPEGRKMPRSDLNGRQRGRPPCQRRAHSRVIGYHKRQHSEGPCRNVLPPHINLTHNSRVSPAPHKPCSGKQQLPRPFPDSPQLYSQGTAWLPSLEEGAILKKHLQCSSMLKAVNLPIFMPLYGLQRSDRWGGKAYRGPPPLGILN